MIKKHRFGDRAQRGGDWRCCPLALAAHSDSHILSLTCRLSFLAALDWDGRPCAILARRKEYMKTIWEKYGQVLAQSSHRPVIAKVKACASRTPLMADSGSLPRTGLIQVVAGCISFWARTLCIFIGAGRSTPTLSLSFSLVRTRGFFDP